jgi:hypothetical protein
VVDPASHHQGDRGQRPHHSPALSRRRLPEPPPSGAHGLDERAWARPHATGARTADAHPARQGPHAARRVSGAVVARRAGRRFGGDPLGQLVENKAAGTPEDGVMPEDVARQVERAMAPLSPREQEVLRLRFGLGTDRACTLEEIGDASPLRASAYDRSRRARSRSFERPEGPLRIESGGDSIRISLATAIHRRCRKNSRRCRCPPA